jgi:hypothetical protein|tara:strand:+ start:486 stop:848 length:363 start_codon:yes stop_codon:yes gene_type:complete
MIKCAFMGFGITLICIIIPLVHFLTGPLAPLIGGWFAGNKFKANTKESLILSLLMGVFMIIPLSGIILTLTYTRHYFTDVLAMPLPSNEFIRTIPLYLLIYITSLGFIGSIIGGRMGKNI